MQSIVLCADRESLAHPELLGLEDVNLDAVPWLTCFSQAAELRERIAAGMAADEIWVVSSDDVEAVNLVAALRKDNPETTLLLVVSKATGSMLSRAQSAGANGTLTTKGFAERFALENVRYARMQEAACGGADITAPLPACEVSEMGGADEQAEQDGIAEDVDLDLLEDIPMPPAKAGNALSSKLADYRASHEVEGGGSQAFIFTVLSGSGGAGKSTVAAISAAVAAARGQRTLLIDCDLQFGDVHKLLGIENPVTLDDVLEEPEKLESLGAVGGSAGGRAGGSDANDCGPFLLAAPKRLEQGEIIGQHLPYILDVASALFDVIVVNTGANWADHHAVLLERSECSLLLVDQRASSVRACQHALELCARLGIASGSFVYAVNHCERGALFTSLDVAFVMQGAHVYELKEGGAAVEEMLGAGLLRDLMASKNDLCSSVEEMLDELLPERQSTKKKLGRSRKKIDFGATKKASKRSPRRRGRGRKRDELPVPLMGSTATEHALFGSGEDGMAGLWRS